MTTPAGSTSREASPGKLVYTADACSVTQEQRGGTALLRFVGTCSAALVDWLRRWTRENRVSCALKLRELTEVGSDFIREIVAWGLEAGRRRQNVAVVDPSPELLMLLRAEKGDGAVTFLAGDATMAGGGSIPDWVEKEKKALEEIASRFAANPLWRRVDQEEVWLCPLCGAPAEEVRISHVLKPSPEALLGVRAHLLERCRAWRAGRTTPFPASMLDSFLAAANRKKSAAAETKRKAMHQQIETLKHLEESVSEAQRRVFHLLPIEPEPDPAADIAVVYRPLQSVGGDYLDFYALDGDLFGVGMGDVSGHGIEAAIVMGMAKMAMRVRSRSHGGPKEMMALANRDLFEELRRTAFVTGFFGLIDRPSRRMSYVRAGHPPPLLRRAAGGCEELDAAGLPFGVDGGPRFDAGLVEQEVALAAGDVLLLYTDGATESGTTEEFGVERLKQALMSAPLEADAHVILGAVVAAFDGFLAGAAPGDDVTLVCLKIR